MPWRAILLGILRNSVLSVSLMYKDWMFTTLSICFRRTQPLVLTHTTRHTTSLQRIKSTCPYGTLQVGCFPDQFSCFCKFLCLWPMLTLSLASTVCHIVTRIHKNYCGNKLNVYNNIRYPSRFSRKHFEL